MSDVVQRRLFWEQAEKAEARDREANMRTATITKEWGEVGFGSYKRDGYAWEVSFFENGVKIDGHTYKLHCEKFARENIERFLAGDFERCEYGGVRFP